MHPAGLVAPPMHWDRTGNGVPTRAPIAW